MNEHLLKIDVSNSKYKSKEDLIKIGFQNEDDIQINFTIFFIQSNYIRNKYKYSEALESIQNEIDESKNKFNINEKSIIDFIKLLQDEKVNIPIERYKDIYTLSEYFDVPKFTFELDNIGQKELFKDLNFTIQILLDSETAKDNIDTKLNSKIENFLIERINECIKNSKFNELPVSTIFRIVDQSKEKVDHNLLVDFILESAETRFILFKFVELHKMTNVKVKKIIKFIGEQNEDYKKIYLDYMKFNLEFIENIIDKHDQVFNELNERETELNKTKQELNETKEELNVTKQKFNETNKKLNETKTEQNKTKKELNETRKWLNVIKQKFNETNKKLNETKQKLNETKDELNETKQKSDQVKSELKHFEDKFNRIKSEKKQYTQTIIVSGADRFNQLGEKPTKNDENGIPIISPPVVLSFDPSSILSYSIYSVHSVLVTRDGSLKGVGSNCNCSISATLQKGIIDHFTDFTIKDGSRQLTAVSAVCGLNYTLYMFSKSDGSGRQLVFCDVEINEGNQVFLDIGNHHPVSLFGGRSHSAAIGSEGEVIFINRDSVKNSPNSPITAVFLPDGEKASSVACCEDSVVVLSSKGRVYTSPIQSNRVLKFSIVSELSGQEIVCVSGAFEHYLAVSKEGRVFGCGSNKHGQLGLGEEIESVSSFTEILSLVGYEIRAAYAGYWHSLFETREGKILSCGSNCFDQLLLSSAQGENVYSPTETTIRGGASFCIAGSNLSIVFIGSDPPPNTPNKRLYH